MMKTFSTDPEMIKVLSGVVCFKLAIPSDSDANHFEMYCVIIGGNQPGIPYDLLQFTFNTIYYKLYYNSWIIKVKHTTLYIYKIYITL